VLGWPIQCPPLSAVPRTPGTRTAARLLFAGALKRSPLWLDCAPIQCALPEIHAALFTAASVRDSGAPSKNIERLSCFAASPNINVTVHSFYLQLGMNAAFLAAVDTQTNPFHSNPHEGPVGLQIRERDMRPRLRG